MYDVQGRGVAGKDTTERREPGVEAYSVMLEKPGLSCRIMLLSVVARGDANSQALSQTTKSESQGGAQESVF